MAALESIALLQNLSRNELQALRAIAQERHFAAGAATFSFALPLGEVKRDS